MRLVGSIGRALLVSSGDDAPDEAAVRARRLEVARRNGKWREVREEDFVARGPFLVHVDSDHVYTRFRAAVFAAGSASLLNDSNDLAFHETSDGDLVFLERQPGTWSERVAARARRGAA